MGAPKGEDNRIRNRNRNRIRNIIRNRTRNRIRNRLRNRIRNRIRKKKEECLEKIILLLRINLDRIIFVETSWPTSSTHRHSK